MPKRELKDLRPKKRNGCNKLKARTEKASYLPETVGIPIQTQPQYLHQPMDKRIHRPQVSEYMEVWQETKVKYKA